MIEKGGMKMKQLNVRVSDETAKQFKMKVLESNATSQDVLKALVKNWIKGGSEENFKMHEKLNEGFKELAKKKKRPKQQLIVDALCFYLNANN